MISGLPKIDYSFTFEPSKPIDLDSLKKKDSDLLDAMLRRRQFDAQTQSKTNTDIEQKFGQLYQLTNQEIDGQWADKFQEMFSTQFSQLSDLAQKNDPSFWMQRQKVAQSVVDFKNQIKQAQGIRDQIKTVLESDPAYAHLNKNQFTEYIIRKNFYNTTQSPDGKINTQTLKNPGDIKGGVVIDPVKLEAYYKDKKDKIPGLEAYLNSIGNDYTKFASDLMLNPEFTKAIKAKVGSAEVMRFESQTTINNNTSKADASSGFQHPQNSVNDVIKKNSAAGTYDVSASFDGYSDNVPVKGGMPGQTTKEPFSVSYTTGAAQPFKVSYSDGRTRSFSVDGFKRYLFNLDATGTPYGETPGKKIP